MDREALGETAGGYLVGKCLILNLSQMNTQNITLEDIRIRKEELDKQLGESEEKIATLWHSLLTPKKAASRGEQVTALISNGITAFDTFMLVWKLFHQYGHIFHRKKKR